MFTRITLAATALAALLATPPAAAQTSSSWSDRAPWGSVTVSADRQHIAVCDLSNDGQAVRVEYATSYLQRYTVVDSNGAKWGCGTDRTWISLIGAFKLCQGAKNGPCQQSIWMEGHRSGLWGRL